MSIYFNENFKRLRNKADLTQEQVAEIFNTSPQSVSRWETGANYPDIEILPHIAGFFKVTVDALLGTDEILGKKKAAAYTKDIRNLLNSGKLDDAIALARKATKEFPLHAGLHYHLVQALSAACKEETPGHAENTAKFKEEIIAISERMINLSDYPSSLGHRVQLIEQYVQWDMKVEAKRLLETLPSEIWYTQEPWSGLVLEGDKWQKNQENRIVRAKYYLEYLLSGYLNKAALSTAQKIECRKAKMQIESLIDKITGDLAVPLELAFENMALAELYCEAQDVENALTCVEKATLDAMYHRDQMDKTNETDGGNYMAWSTPRNLCWILWEDYLAKPPFDPIRDSERFQKCFAQLKANSHELT